MNLQTLSREYASRLVGSGVTEVVRVAVGDLLFEAMRQIESETASHLIRAADRAINAARPLQEHHEKRVDGEEKWCSLCKLEDCIDRWDEASEEYR